MLTLPQVAALDLFGALFPALYVGGTLQIHLYQNNFIPGPLTVLADFVDATFDGYASQAMPRVGTPFTNSVGQAEQDFQLINWTMTGAVTPNTIYGYFVTFKPAVGAENLIWAERFDAPITMSGAGQQINVTTQFTGVSAF